jgi:FixJ family two-component response regulator
MTTAPALISIVDDDESVRDALKSLLESMGYRAEVFPSGEAFLNSPYLSQTDCLVADVRMAGMTGLELQAVDFLKKPFSEDALVRAITACLDKS